MSLVIIYILTVALFLVIVFSLGAQSKIVTRLNGVLLFFVGISGILLYGYGFSKIFPSLPQAAVRTLFAVFCMFLGRNEIGTISQVPGLQTPIMQLLIYLTHLLALYCTASAVIATLGGRLIRTVRLWLFKSRDLNLIYGANDASIAFAEQLQSEKRGDIIFVDGDKGASFESNIFKMGSLLFTDGDAKKPDAAFFQRIGMAPNGRKLNVYCLNMSPSANLQYAQNMNMLLKDGGYAPEQVSLAAILTEEISGVDLLAPADRSKNKPGAFNSVLAIEKPDMMVRLMIKSVAPYETMSFDSDGRALSDFETLVIGFGQTGQAALRHLYANGQFEGSNFHATVVSTNYNEKAGSFFFRYPGLKERDCFTVLNDNARSVAFYTYLEEHVNALKYVVICTGNEKENAEIAYELKDYLVGRAAYPAIMLIGENGVRQLTEEKGISAPIPFYSTEVLVSDKIDAMAKVINHQYHLNEGHTAEEDWAACDYFSRLSCRASADYLDAFLKIAGTDRGTVAKEGWNPEGEMLENLSKTEHLRWCAFHETMGYRVMPADVYAAREQQFEREKAETGKGKIRIGKDTVNRLHACLVPWDDLDQLSARENAVTGKSLDYKEMDRDNVRMIAEMLKNARAMEKGAAS